MKLQFLPPGALRLHGPLGKALDKVIANRLRQLDYGMLTAIFRDHSEKDDKWRCEFWGKVVRSAVYAWRGTGDAELKKIIDKTVADILSTQSDDGCISSYPAGKQLGGWDIWGRKYVLVALTAYYKEMNQDPVILEKICAMARQLLRKAGNLRDYGQHFGLAAASTLRVLVEIAELSGDEEILAGAKLLADSGCCQVHDIFEAARIGASPSEIGNGKSYEMTSCFQGLAAMYDLDNDPLKLEAVLNYYNLVHDEEIFITGGGGLKDGNGEFWYHGKERQIRPDCGGIGETCITATWLWYSLKILTLTGDPQIAERMERCLYNAMLGAVVPDGSNFLHINPYLTGGWKQPSGDQMADFPGHDCCRAQGPYGLAAAPVLAVMATGNGYAVNLYEDLEVTGVLAVSGSYPSDGKVTVTLLKSGKFDIALRIPSEFACRIDGKTVPGGQYAVLNRNWQAGDKITLEFDLSLRQEKLAGMTAQLRGPLVLCREEGADENACYLFKENGLADYASAGMKLDPANTLVVWE